MKHKSENKVFHLKFTIKTAAKNTVKSLSFNKYYGRIPVHKKIELFFYKSE